ncbi:MAG TPA: mechanosensitive ion channel domain-containing protein [Casimicrobiaceae bacterium]|nr:mechanosensitive ion channel domain-containing protein [Casimicrobiaceae bacterium]
MSDQQVRGLLIEQLDRVAKAPASGEAAHAGGGMMEKAGMAGMMEMNAGTMRSQAQAIFVAFLWMPETLRDIVDRLNRGAGDSDGVARIAGALALMLVIGLAVEWLYGFALRRVRARLAQTAGDTYFARAFQLGASLALRLGALAVFALGAVAVYLAIRSIPDLWRIVLIAALLAIVAVRVTALLVRFLLSPAGAGERLLPFDDRTARGLRAYAIAISVLFGIVLVAASVMGAADIDDSAQDVVRIGAWLLGLAVTLSMVWTLRQPVAALIRGGARGRATVRGWLADLWPIIATMYFVGLFAASLHGILTGARAPLGIGFESVLVVVIVPIIDLALCRALAAAVAAQRSASGGAAPHWLAAYEPIFRRAVHIVTVVFGILIFARLWGLRLFAYANSFGGDIASSILGIGIVLLATYLAWQIATVAIDRRLRAEGDRPSDVPSSRLVTVLPILRATILVTIAVMATMSVLAALGVNILPLLAGASIVGVAIGFGSQTLVKDIVSGAFFLMDDAFRLGEYIEVGDAKGRVEKINVRSVFLRHHRGALNVVPYGDIRRLRNTSRDWAVHVMEFRLTYDTNMLQVKKILKKIGEDLLADPDYAPDILQPLKSAGVMAAEDSAIVVRAKFTARPTNNAWVVRRMTYDRIIRDFRAAGIMFAHRQVTVNLPPGHGDEAAAGAGAGSEIATERGA